MNNILKNLITKKFYADKDTATVKVDTCFAMNKITADQYSDLVMLINEHYPLPAEEAKEQPTE